MMSSRVSELFTVTIYWVPFEMTVIYPVSAPLIPRSSNSVSVVMLAIVSYSC